MGLLSVTLLVRAYINPFTLTGALVKSPEVTAIAATYLGSLEDSPEVAEPANFPDPFRITSENLKVFAVLEFFRRPTIPATKDQVASTFSVPSICTVVLVMVPLSIYPETPPNAALLSVMLAVAVLLAVTVTPACKTTFTFSILPSPVILPDTRPKALSPFLLKDD